MVSLWPWSGDSNSPASFEKTLSTLSSKITASQARLDRTRARSRRLKALSTLYLSFAYLVYVLLLFVVVGYNELGMYEWSGLAGGPVLIYAVRKVVSTYFAFRIDSYSARLKTQQTEREKTIQKLKDATKYDSTAQLIEKYGGEDKSKAKKSDSAGPDGKDSDAPNKGRSGPGQRTHMPPPPTANIQRPQSQSLNKETPPESFDQPRNKDALAPSAEFAPNAFGPASSSRPSSSHHRSAASHNLSIGTESHWYDRIFDVLLGEDEAAPKNRIVLICANCRLVNGQAPPGTRSLADVGMWRCMACHASNGEVDEGKRIVEEVLAAKGDSGDVDEPIDREPILSEEDSTSAELVSIDEDQEGPAASVRKRRGQKAS